MRLRGLIVAFFWVAALPAAAQPPLPGVDGTVCDFVAANAGRKLDSLVEPTERIGVYAPSHVFSDMLLKVAVADLDGDGDLEVLSINPIAGTMKGDVPVVYGSATLASYNFNSDDEHIRWSHTARWLSFNGAWYLVYFENEALNQAKAVVAISDKPDLVCRFDAGFAETDAYPATSPAVGAAFDALRAVPIESRWKYAAGALAPEDRTYLTTIVRSGDDPLRDAGESIRAWSISINPASAVRSADLDGDGIKERMAFVQVMSGAGRGCDALFLELLPPLGKTAADPVLRNLVRSMQSVDWDGFLPAPCGSFNDFIEVEGRGYLYINRLSSHERHRRLKQVKDGFARDAISSSFTPTHKVIFDRSKGGPVNRGDRQ